jgi:hypothetical protein
MNTDTAWPEPAPGAPDPATLHAELTGAGWVCSGFDWTGGTKSEYLESPGSTLAVEVQTSSNGARLLFDAPVTEPQYGWNAEAPLLPTAVILAVAAANDGPSTYLAEHDDRQPEPLLDAGWIDESYCRWVSPDGQAEIESGDIDGTPYALRVGRDGGQTQILLTECASDQVLHAFATGTVLAAPETAAPDASTDSGGEVSSTDDEGEPFLLPHRWGATAAASERGQQHVRLALSMAGAEDWPLDCPGLLDRIAAAVPLIIEDLHALAYREGLDTARLGLAPRHP